MLKGIKHKPKNSTHSCSAAFQAIDVIERNKMAENLINVLFIDRKVTCVLFGLLCASNSLITLKNKTSYSKFCINSFIH
jgi:hypothetical protein